MQEGYGVNESLVKVTSNPITPPPRRRLAAGEPLSGLLKEVVAGLGARAKQ